MDQDLEPIEPRTSLPVEELAEGTSHADSVKDRLTGTDADRFINMTKPVETDNRTPTQVADALGVLISNHDSTMSALLLAFDNAREEMRCMRREMRVLYRKQVDYDEALMKANAQISAGLPKYPKMLYGLNGGTFIVATEAIRQNIHDHTCSWPNATKSGWFDTPTERDDYAKAHGLL